MEFAIKYIYSLGTMALLAVAFGISLQFDRSEKLSRVGLGLLFGIAATMAMNNPIPIADGVIVDPRNLFIGLSAAFLGLWGGIPALLVAISARSSLGGVGVERVTADAVERGDGIGTHALVGLGVEFAQVIVAGAHRQHAAMLERHHLGAATDDEILHAGHDPQQRRLGDAGRGEPAAEDRERQGQDPHDHEGARRFGRPDGPRRQHGGAGRTDRHGLGRVGPPLNAPNLPTASREHACVPILDKSNPFASSQLTRS